MNNAADSLRPGTTYAAILGRVLAYHREQAGLEQAELAGSLGVGQSSWSRIERGDSVINIEQLRTVAKKLGVGATQLLSEADTAADELEARDVTVETSKASKKENNALAWIAVGALTALVIAAISKK